MVQDLWRGPFCKQKKKYIDKKKNKNKKTKKKYIDANIYEAVVLKDCKVIVEDVLENEKTPNECVHEYLNQETDQSRKSLPK